MISDTRRTRNCVENAKGMDKWVVRYSESQLTFTQVVGSIQFLNIWVSGSLTLRFCIFKFHLTDTGNTRDKLIFLLLNLIIFSTTESVAMATET